MYIYLYLYISATTPPGRPFCYRLGKTHKELEKPYFNEIVQTLLAAGRKIACRRPKDEARGLEASCIPTDSTKLETSSQASERLVKEDEA